MTTTATAPAVPRALPTSVRRRARLPWISPEGQPPWARPALLVLAVIAGSVYAVGLRNKELHNFYNPAVKSMSESWRAWLYGGYDPAASITLDKLPGAFQVEALSARIFGFNAWSVLAPQVVESVLAVLVLYGVVRRWLGPAAGLLAAAAFATTPIVAALSHAQISDTLLVLLLILAVDAWQRALDQGRLGWLLLAGCWVGLAFQTKMVQAWGVLPALALVYLLAAPITLRRRLGHLALAGVVTAAMSMWWIVMVLLTPATARPYIDGSMNNSPLSMVFEYNLFSRYASGSDGNTLGIPGRGGAGWSFMLNTDIAPQVGWLYPLALTGLVIGVWWRGRAPRTDVVRAGFLFWGLWLAVHAAAFSTGRVAHSFYVVAVAPAVSALAAGGLVLAWRAYRRGTWRRWVLPAAVGVTVAWAVYLSSRFPTFLPWMRPVLIVLGASSVALLISVPALRRRPGNLLLGARLALVAGGLAVVAVLVGPAAWATSTTNARYSGSSIGPAAGPMGGFGPGGFGGAGRGGGGGGFRGGGPGGGGFGGGGFGGGGFGGGGFGPGGSGAGAGRGDRPDAPAGAGAGGFPGGGFPGGGFPGGGRGGPMGSDQPSAQTTQLVAYLRAHQPGSKYLLATQGSSAAGPFILTGASVLPIGGFSGQVPSTTPAQLAKLVAAGQLRYVLVGGGGGPGRGGNAAISDWVTAHCNPVTDPAVQTTGLYDCATR